MEKQQTTQQIGETDIMKYLINISERLNYYEKRFDALESLISGDGKIIEDKIICELEKDELLSSSDIAILINKSKVTALKFIYKFHSSNKKDYLLIKGTSTYGVKIRKIDSKVKERMINIFSLIKEELRKKRTSDSPVVRVSLSDIQKHLTKLEGSVIKNEDIILPCVFIRDIFPNINLVTKNTTDSNITSSFESRFIIAKGQTIFSFSLL